MTTTEQLLREALQTGLEYARLALGEHDAKYGLHPATEADRKIVTDDIALIESALAQPAEGGEVVAQGRGVMEHMMLVAQRAAESVDRLLWSPKAERRAICKAILADKNLLRKLRDVAPPASQEQAVARFNWYKGGFEWLVPYNFDRHNMRPLYLAPEGAEAARKAAQEQLYAERERHTAEVKKLQAEIGRLKASHSQAQQPNEWRDMIQERFDVNHSAMPSDPREAVLKLIRDEVSMALDPACSSQAEALIQRGRDEAQQPMPRLCIGDSHMESLIDAAIQSHSETKDAMRWLVRQLAAKPSGGEVVVAEFEREQRYIVIKLSDLRASEISGDDLQALNRVCQSVANNREQTGKQPLRCVVVESDWPEYEPTWQAIEQRVAGTTPPAPKQPMTWPRINKRMEYAAQDEFHILPPRLKRLWARMEDLADKHHHGITSAKDGGV